MSDFKKDLEVLINKHSMGNECDTPDFILAKYMYSCLESFIVATRERTCCPATAVEGVQSEKHVNAYDLSEIMRIRKKHE